MERAIKLIKPTAWARIHNGSSVGIAVMVFFCTVFGFIFTLYKPFQLDLLEIVAVFLAIAFLGAISAYFKGHLSFIPPVVIDELSKERHYELSFCDQNSLREADEMTIPYFGNDFIPCEQIEKWRLKNYKGFIHIKNNDGLLCACFVILGLEHTFFEQFIAGRLTEHDIDEKVILDFEDMKKESRIYISGVVVRDPSSYMGAKRARIMLWGMLQYIKDTFGLRKNREFYAVALTRESETLLRNLGFSVSQEKSRRKDNCNLYKITLDKSCWDKLLARIGDMSSMADINTDEQ